MATGTNYPTSFDSFVDKVTGDFFTVSDCNIRSSAIEKLESGPLRPLDGSVSLPAHSYRDDVDTGMWRSATNTLDFAAGGVRVLQMATVASAVDYFILQPSAAGGAPRFLVEGTDTNISVVYDSKGTGLHIWRRNSGATEDARLQTGIYLVGATVITNAAAGDVVLANNRNYRGLNTGASSCRALIGLDSADRVLIAGDGNDVRWGNALIALGGGAAPTLGTIGGSGPTTAAQQSWMKWFDTGGNAFWLPLWK